MESVASDLKVVEMKQHVLRKAFEDLHSQTNSVLLLTLQWKDLEEHLESTRMSLLTKFDEIEIREKQVSSREKELQGKESELTVLLESKKTELHGIQKLIEERVGELECNLEKNDSIKLLIEENSEELLVKEKQYHVMEMSILEKGKELGLLKKSVAERRKRLDLIDKNLKERREQTDLKRNELHSVQVSLKKCSDEIVAKEKKLSEIQKSLEDRTKEFHLIEEQLEALRNSIDECNKEIKLKEEKLSSIETSLIEWLNELHVEENRLDLVQREVQLKQKQFGSLKKSGEVLSKKLEMKEMKFEDLVEAIELKEKQIEEELDLFNDKVNELFKEVESKEKNFDSLKSSLEERSSELMIKETEFEKRVKEFESKVKEFYPIAKPVEQNTEKMNYTMKTERLEYAPISDNVPSSANDQHCIISNVKSLQCLLNQHLKRHDLVHNKINSILQASLDPSKLVLEVMHGFFREGENQEFDVRSCIILLGELLKATPQISPHVKGEAAKLAIRWKAKMTVAAENSVEVFGFLQLIAVFKLNSIFNADELRSLSDMVDQHRQIPELRQIICVSDIAPLSAPLKLEPTENIPISNASNSSNLDLATTSGRSSLWCADELSTLNDLTQFDYFAYLETSADPAKLVLQFIQGSLSQHWKKRDVVIQPSEIKGYILIVDQLTKISPQIGDCVKKDAVELVRMWRTKMNESSLEILCFMQFLTTYKLDWMINEDDTLKFFKMIPRCKVALEFCQTLTFSNKVLGFVRELIGKKKVFEAVRLIFAFKLNKFSPVELLKDYLEYAKKTRKNERSIAKKEKARDVEITALKTVKQFIKDYKLESKFSSKDIDNRIAMLENNRRQLVSSFITPEVEEQNRGKKRGHFALVNNNQSPRQQSENKFPRVAESTARHYPPPSDLSPFRPPSLYFLPPVDNRFFFNF